MLKIFIQYFTPAKSKKIIRGRNVKFFYSMRDLLKGMFYFFVNLNKAKNKQNTPKPYLVFY